MRALRTAVLCAAIAASGSCRNVLGIDDREVTAKKCGAITTTASCADCLERRCCGEGLACATDKSCNEAVACEAGCTDSACRATCDAKPYTPARTALVSCRASTCSAECAVQCSDAIVASADCRQCAGRSCCTVINACLSLPSCNEMRTCVARCGTDAKCAGECANSNDEGVSRWFAVRDCIEQSCAAPCASWTCGRIAAPTTTASELAVVVRVIDAETFGPIAGAVVRGCSELSPDCVPAPFGETTTDSSGLARLVVKPNSTTRNYGGFFEIVDAEHKGLAYFHPPATVSGAKTEIVLPSAKSIAGIASASDVAILPDRGLVVIAMIDCRDAPGVGVAITTDRADGETRTFYFDGAAPSIKVSVTDAGGIAGFMNAKPGAHTITATVGGETVARTNVLVRAGYTTFTRLRAGFM
jgi:hypothetical protein